jgi:fructose-specific phosphotransferase system component IIB
MSNFNKGEIGVILRVAAEQDISSASPVIIIAEPEVGTAKEFTATVPAVDVTVDNVTYTANEYAEYTTTSEEDLDYVGRWRMKLKATFSSTDVAQTNYVKFRVLA